MSAMNADYATVDTPAGPFTTVVADDAVIGSGWTADVPRLLQHMHPTIRPVAVKERNELGRFTKAVEAFHAGDIYVIDDIPVRQRSGPFREHAWDVLRTVDPGAPITYSEYAARAGNAAAVRAAASACARNSAALFVPCHRVIRIGGGLGGFGWGLDVKRWLLDHEERHVL